MKYREQYLRQAIGVLFFAVSAVCSVQAQQYTLNHKKGESGKEMVNGRQAVHELHKTIYLSSGETIRLKASTHQQIYDAWRYWYMYEDETAQMTNLTRPEAQYDLYNIGRNGNEAPFAIIQTANTGKGDNATDFPVYEMPENPASEVIIACDQSNYTDYQISGKTITEPTLSQRVLFHIKPASEMAALVDANSGDGEPSIDNEFLEEYKLMAPVGKQIYIGPQYEFFAGANFPNYYYTDDRLFSTTIEPLSDVTWLLYEDGQERELTADELVQHRYVGIESNSAGSKNYMLVARTGWFIYKYHRIAKFEVEFVDANAYGPVLAPTNADDLVEMDVLYEENFNYQKPTTDYAAYHLPLVWEESSYGFYYSTLAVKRLFRDGTDPYWSDYALLNSSNGMNATYFYHNVYNHGTTATAEDAREGYFLYVDGNKEPGRCFSLEVDANLCPGQQMMFSAYVSVLNIQGALPQLEFIVVGIDGNGNEVPVVTYATGEIDTSNALSPGGKWLRIVFPLEITEADIYDEYRLTINNKAANVSGNDFAIDDLQVFVSRPTVMPLQASTSVCVDPEGDNIITYLRVDYETNGFVTGKIYYRWAEADGSVMDMPYYGKGGTGVSSYGQVTINKTTISDNGYATLGEFDTEVVANGADNAIGFVEEAGKTVLYIATRAHLVPGETYKGYMATSLNELGDLRCGMETDLRVMGSMYMTIDNEELLSGDTLQICGDHMVKIGLQRLMINNATTGTDLLRASCYADYLWGTPEWVDANKEAYGYDFATIESAIRAKQQNQATAEQEVVLERLESESLLELNQPYVHAYLQADDDTRLLHYTAFPIEGTGRMLDENGEITDEEVEICTDYVSARLELIDVGAKTIYIGTEEDYHSENALPNFLVKNGRTVRVNHADLQAGTLTLPIHYDENKLAEDADKVFHFENVRLFATTDPAYMQLGLSLSLMNPEVKATSTEITLQGCEVLNAGYEYTFILSETPITSNPCATGESIFKIAVVPDRVVWSPSNSSAWHSDANWVTEDGKPAFMPTEKTDVILEEGEYVVPIRYSDAQQQADVRLEEDAQLYVSYDIGFTPYVCRNLYVPANTALANQHLLQVKGNVVVDMTVPANQWILCSLPVAGAVSGDFWYPASGESTDPFTVKPMQQSPGSYAGDRLTHKVYQSLYNKSIMQYSVNPDLNIPIKSSTWTAPLNSVSTPYPAGMGVALWVKNTGGSEVTFRLPKQETAYRYYGSKTSLWGNTAIPIDRPTAAGRLAYTATETTPYAEYTLVNDTAGTVFLFGNPSLAYIDMEALIEGNPLLASTFHIITEGTEELTANIGTTAADGSSYSLLPPQRAVLLQTNSPCKELTLRLTTDMIMTSYTPFVKKVKEAPAVQNDNILYMAAKIGSFTSRAVLEESVQFSAYYDTAEDASCLLLDKEKTPFVFYTLSQDKVPLSINRSNSGPLIPLSYYAYESAKNELNLTFTGNTDRWELYDSHTGSYSALIDGVPYLLTMPTDGSLRYYLHRVGKDNPSTDVLDNTTANACSVFGSIGKLVVRSSAAIKAIRVCDVVGRNVMSATEAGEYALPAGCYVVSVTLMDNSELNKSVLIR